MRIRSSRAVVIGAAVVVAISLLSATPATAAKQPPPTYEETLAKFAAQDVQWNDCFEEGLGEFECADISLPLDWHNPKAGTIKTDITRVKATGPNRRGILLTNPGGPGSFGYWVPAYLAATEPELNEVYDLIGIDPRGTWLSELKCSGKPLEPVYALDGRDTSPAAVAIATKGWSKWAKDCGNKKINKYINSDQNVRDLDLVRALLGEPKFSFLGWSAGTWLGAWYATLFPQHVDRFLFDGNGDWSHPWIDGFREQPKAFQESWDNYFVPWIADHDDVYHLGKTPKQVTKTYEARRAALQANPLHLPDGTKIGATEFDYGATTAGYETNFFPDIAAALAAFEKPVKTAEDFDLIASWFTAIPSDPTQNVFLSTVCNDTAPYSIENTFEWGVKTIKKYPLVGSGQFIDVCDFWPNAPIGSPVTGQGIPPLLMLQNDHDPATSFAEAKRAHKATPGSVMITIKNQSDHTIYTEGNPCVEQYANDWLINGILPAKDKSCPGNPLPEPAFANARVAAGLPSFTELARRHTH